MLRSGGLQALRISVHPDARDRKKIVEQYTFKINYLSHTKDAPISMGLDFDGPSASQITVEAVNSALQEFIRNLIKLCNTLPELPSKSELR